MQKRLYIFLIFILASFMLSYAGKTLIYLEHSETLEFDEANYPDCQILNGNVVFRHDDALMYCDKAFFFNKSNNINAHGNIKMIQGDSLTVYADHLYYNGDTKIARLRNNVRLENKELTLYTDSLNYDRKNNVGYYFLGGKIVDSTNVLTSTNGKYYPNHDIAVFQNNVVLNNKDFDLFSDTLKYETVGKVAYILGPSDIVQDSTRIYSEYGWYNTIKDNAKLINNSHIRDLEGRRLSADTLFYNQRTGEAEGFKNVALRDSTQAILLNGGYGIYNEKTNKGFMVDRATIIDFSSADSMFITSDTIYYDASKEDNTHIKAYYNVQSWHVDFQSLCDSLFYNSKDSTAQMFGTPILWNENNQITGESIKMYTKNETINKVEIIGSAFIYSKEDTLAINQVSGKHITAYLADGKISKADVSGNALSIYFVEEDNESASEDTPTEYVGINRAESSELHLYFGKKNQIKKIVMTPSSNGVMYTPDKINQPKVTKLDGFADYEYMRPKDQNDIYNYKNKKALEEAVANSKTSKRRRTEY
jgi:lipopolysaccharide export system protein LptA